MTSIDTVSQNVFTGSDKTLMTNGGSHGCGMVTKTLYSVNFLALILRKI